MQQAAFYLALGAIPASIFIYSISRADEDGKLTGMSSLIDKYTQMQETWAERNARRTAAVEQAAFDKHLLYNAPRNKHIELKFPEYVLSFFLPSTPYVYSNLCFIPWGILMQGRGKIDSDWKGIC